MQFTIIIVFIIIISELLMKLIICINGWVWLGGLKGVESVKAESKANKLTLIGKVDPSKVQESLAQKTKKKVELVSPKKDNKDKKEKKNDGENNNNNDDDEDGDKKKKGADKNSKDKSDEKKLNDKEKGKQKSKEVPSLFTFLFIYFFSESFLMVPSIMRIIVLLF